MKFLHSLKQFSLYSLSQFHVLDKIDWGTATSLYKNEILVVRILKEITKHLVDLQVHPLDLCEFLYETKSVIAGSLTLQCYLDEYYSNSDLDIFTQQALHTFIFPLEKAITTPRRESEYDPDWWVTTIKSVQVIYISPTTFDSIYDFIKTFDIDICKIVFDGRKFYFPSDFPLNLKYDRKANVTGEINPRKFLRIIKYQSRNFKISTFDKNEYEVYKLNDLKFISKDLYYSKDYKYYFKVNNLNQIEDFKIICDRHNRQYYHSSQRIMREDETTNIINLNYYGSYQFINGNLYDLRIIKHSYYSSLYLIICEIELKTDDN